jgi:hypothetical protein
MIKEIEQKAFRTLILLRIFFFTLPLVYGLAAGLAHVPTKVSIPTIISLLTTASFLSWHVERLKRHPKFIK